MWHDQSRFKMIVAVIPTWKAVSFSNKNSVRCQCYKPFPVGQSDRQISQYSGPFGRTKWKRCIFVTSQGKIYLVACNLELPYLPCDVIEEDLLGACNFELPYLFCDIIEEAYLGAYQATLISLTSCDVIKEDLPCSMKHWSPLLNFTSLRKLYLGTCLELSYLLYTFVGQLLDYTTR